ncbi:MAG TPA: hypothetical protein VNN17_11510 [Terriglobia bacterium]|nr:hypothetical protein [Terriglobia bacterium]
MPSGKVQESILSTVAWFEQNGGRVAGPASAGAPAGFSTPFVRVDDRRRVQLYPEVDSVSPERLAQIESGAGLEVELVNEALKTVQVWVPYDQIETLAQWDFVRRIRPPSYATYRIGSRTTEGDRILKADLARNTLGLTGAGIFSTNAQGSGQGAILISNTPFLAAPEGSIPGNAARPVNRGEFTAPGWAM